MKIDNEADLWRQIYALPTVEEQVAFIRSAHQAPEFISWFYASDEYLRYIERDDFKAWMKQQEEEQDRQYKKPWES